MSFTAPCTEHSERVGTLTVELPSIGVRRFLCAECRDALMLPKWTPRWLDPATPQWEREALTGAAEHDAQYYYAVTDAKGDTHGGEWRHPNSIARRK